MTNTLGEQIFNEIESNEYLQEIYEAILYNYSLKLFDLKDQTPVEFNLNHALRFADLLSKSTNSVKSDRHRVWAQEIVAILCRLYPENEMIEFYMGSVLTNVCNYRGLSFHSNVYKPVNTFEEIYDVYKKNLLKIPASSDKYFFKSQKVVYDAFKKEQFSYSGPTSMGKSFVMRMFIKEQISKGKKQNFAIIVPTKALINEVSSRIISDDLKELLSENDYRVITASGAFSLQQEHNFVLVLTPERMLYLLLERPNFKLDYLFIDEAHKISSKDSRSPFYYKIVNLLSHRKEKPHFIFSSPNIPNPEVYLKLISENQGLETEKMTTSFSPVSQIKYIIDLVEQRIRLHNDHNCKFIDIAQLDAGTSLIHIIEKLGSTSKNIVYCSSTAKAIDYALEYANSISENTENNELIALSHEVKNQIHGDYYLTDLLIKGVAYHIGYLPNDIRMRIEKLFREGVIKTIFCTSTLIEGVNLPADNLFITSYKNGLSGMTPVDFKNLVGRVGRIEFNLYGNVFLVRTDKTINTQKYIELIENEVPEQKLSLVTELSKKQKKKIVECLRQGQIELLKDEKQSYDNYSLMRKFALILLKDILSNTDSVVRREFLKYLTPDDEKTIRYVFSSKKADDDINVSVDQMENLTDAIANGLSYPEFNNSGNIDYSELVEFLEKLSKIYKWDVYEPSTLGHVSKKNGKHGKLRWYAVILAQWIRGNGLSFIMNAAINYKTSNPLSGVEVDGKIVPYNDSKKHRNIVISDTLEAIETVILYRLSNYFLRFSTEYKRLHGYEKIQNDWYEFVEYGTTNPLTRFLQRNGFSREVSTYIKNHLEYVVNVGDDYKIHSSILKCSNLAVNKEVTEIKYNIPELFV